MIKRTYIKCALIFGLIGILAGGAYCSLYTCKTAESFAILEFSDQRDTDFILDVFKNDWWWLVSEHSTDFSPEYMLQYRASSKNMQHRGNLNIKVAYEDNKPVGFVAYYKKEFYYGYILFLDVIPVYRKKGVGYKLLDYAMKDLKAQGVSKVGLVTRTTNTPAQSLYKRYGFKEVSSDDGFVDFEYQMY